MDRAMCQQHLAEAEKHIAQGKRHIADQEDRIGDLERLGADTTEARKLLENFYESQVQHIHTRDRLRRLLGEES